MTPTTATPLQRRWTLVFLAVLILVVAVLVLTWSGAGPTAAQDSETEVPVKPTGLRVTTQQGLLDVSADWDDVEGADEYLVRWRLKDGPLNDGVRVASSSAAITVSDYGEWVVRVQARNNAGCGKPVAKQFKTKPAPPGDSGTHARAYS